MSKKITTKDLDNLAYECAIRNIDLEKTINFITSNETLRYLATLKSKNLSYLQKIFKNKEENTNE